MNRNYRLFALVGTVLMVLMVVAPGAMAVASEDGENTEEAGLSIGVNQSAGNVTVSVVNSTDGSAVANATVNITATDQASEYNVSGETDETGAVAFPTPNETVNVTITAEKNGTTGETTATLYASEDQNAENAGLSIGVSQGAGNVTVSVLNSTDGSPVANATVNITATDQASGYNVSGETDESGIVAFGTPNETVNVTITAEKNGTTGETTATLYASEGQGPSFLPLGQKVAAYVHGLTAGDGPSGPIGLLVADFATSNAGPPEHAGPPEDAGSNTDAVDNEEKKDASPPEAAGPPEDAGPPEHAGPPENAGPNADDHADDEDEEDKGSPDNAGPP